MFGTLLPHEPAASRTKHLPLWKSRHSERKKRSTMLIHELEIRVKAFLLLKPGLHLWIFVRGVFVDDQDAQRPCRPIWRARHIARV